MPVGHGEYHPNFVDDLEIGLAAEAAQLRGLVIVDHSEVVALQILDVVAMPVGHGEYHPNFVDDMDDRRDGLIGIGLSWILRRRRSLRLAVGWRVRFRGRILRRARRGCSLRRLANERASQHKKSNPKQKNARFHQDDLIGVISFIHYSPRPSAGKAPRSYRPDSY